MNKSPQSESTPRRSSALWPRLAALLVAVVFAIGVGAAGPTVGTSGAADTVRVVVQLDEPPLALYRDTLPGVDGVLDARTAKGHLNVNAPASRAYLSHLSTRRADFERRVEAAIPEAVIHWRYGVAFNGVTLQVPRAAIDMLRRLPHVVAVTETYELVSELDETRSLLDVEELWQAAPPSPLGAGGGLRLAMIETGSVNPLHPFFDPTGYTAPPGYPKAQRVAGGQRTDLPIATYASNKVIVGNVYAFPANTSATPFGSRHSAHVAGIMAGVDGTYDYTLASPATFSLPLSGMAPGAYIMSYRVAGDSAEYVAAIEDVVADQADALNLSLGHSRWLTTDGIHDPLRQALDAAVDAGTIVVASAGNAGVNGDSNITGSWKLSPKVITVANSQHARAFGNRVTVTGPGTPPASLRDVTSFAALPQVPPIMSTISGEYVVAPGGTGGNAGDACAPLPAGSMAGKIALVLVRGGCGNDVKNRNLLAAGAIAMIAHWSFSDGAGAMSGFTAPAIPAVMVSLADGRALVAWSQTNAAPTVEVKGPVERLTSGWPDVVFSQSSRGPGPSMEIKPDLAAPGTSVLSSVVNDSTGAVGSQLFDQDTGTSMAAPHVTALAALTKALHPTWTPLQVKSALMNTAETSMFLNTTRTVPALAKDRGAGRVVASRLVDPQLTFDPASISFGLLRPGETSRVVIAATDMREAGDAAAYAITVREVVGDPAVRVTATPALTSTPGDSVTFAVEIATAGAPAGDYEGFVEVRGGGRTYTIPYFVRVQDPGVAKDVLLIDWDRNVGTDFRPVYEQALTGLGLSYDVFDGGTSTAANGNTGPTFARVQNYRTVILFTGNNDRDWSSTHVGGSFALQNYLVAGGQLVLTGQDLNSQLVYNQNTGTDANLTTMTGWVTGGDRFTCPPTPADRNFYGSTVDATAQLETTFTLLEHHGDVSVNVGGDGAGNQRRPDAGRTLTAADSDDPCMLVYNGASIEPQASVLGTYDVTKGPTGGNADRLTDGVATGVTPDATLERPVPRVTWTAALLHVGAEGLNANRGELSPQTAIGLLYDFVADSVSVAVAHHVRGKVVDFVADASSRRGSAITMYRWDFGDGSPIKETAGPTATHEYGKTSRGTYAVRVEAIDALTRTGVGTTTVTILRR